MTKVQAKTKGMFTMTLFRMAISACGAFLLSAAALAQQVEGIAAVVNDEPITTVDVRDRMRLIISSSGIQPTEELLASIQDQALRGLIDETLQLQQAREFEIEVDEAEVDDAIADIAARNGATLDEIAAQLAGSGVDIETLRHQIRSEIAWQILVSGRYRSRVRISDAQIETALERLVQSAQEPQYRLGEILIEIPSAASEDEAISRLQLIYDQLNQGVPFPSVANQFSDAPSSAAGGDSGWLSLDQMRPQISQVVSQLQPGQISNPIRVPGGFMIVALIDQREGQAVEQFTLQQITLPASRVTEASRAALVRAVGGISGCEGVEAAIGGVEGAFVSDLGAVPANALIPQIRDALSGLEDGETTPVLDTAAGAQAFVMCDRSVTGPGVPSPAEIEDNLVSQQLSLLSRRWLRDLRREALIEIR